MAGNPFIISEIPFRIELTLFQSIFIVAWLITRTAAGGNICCSGVVLLAWLVVHTNGLTVVGLWG